MLIGVVPQTGGALVATRRPRSPMTVRDGLDKRAERSSSGRDIMIDGLTIHIAKSTGCLCKTEGRNGEDSVLGEAAHVAKVGQCICILPCS